MSARHGNRRSTAAAIALTAAVTAGAATLLTGCGPAATRVVGAGAPAGSASAAAGGAGSSSSSAPSPSSAPTKTRARVLNGTASNRLTISNGTSKVVMNGTVVDFGIVVRDIAWNPNGTRAAFIDGNGNLEVSDPDGSGRVLVARAPSGETWSHPTWQVVKADKQYGIPAGSFLYFAAAKGGVQHVDSVSLATGHAAPAAITVGGGVDTPALPQAGYTWPSGDGDGHSITFANSGDGEVYVRDDYLRTQSGKVTSGSEPAISPDARSVVFVRSVGGHDHLFVEQLQEQNATARDLTPDATTDYTEPTWSPDGRTIAARVTDGVATLPADGSSAPTRVSSYTGLPVYRG